MHIPNGLWSAATYLSSWLNSSPSTADLQQPLALDVKVHRTSGYAGYPEFKPPSGRQYGEGSDLNCTYENMKGWKFCSTIGDRSCWLKHDNGSRYDSHTDYEKHWPMGKDRYYEFDITNTTHNADGLVANDMKLVNNQYPGPWVQACWGDRIIVKVTNHLEFNGTAIHWHGITQKGSSEMDGVPGITQCPIAPGDDFVYNFTASQYGSSWYHSHYSVQYADGLLGPITIHGPTTARYDEAKPPLLMTDWCELQTSRAVGSTVLFDSRTDDVTVHNSAFRVIHGGKETVGRPSILLNGKGDVTKYHKGLNVSKADIPSKHTLHFEAQPITPVGRAKKYLLRLINTSFDTAFLFSIDHHKLQMVSADFVPIEPYTRSHVLIGIGQRYNVIVEAEPTAYPDKPVPKDGNFWIRTIVVRCFNDPIIPLDGYNMTGILRYNDTRFERTKHDDPKTTPWYDIPDPIPCRDEAMKELVPRLPWQVGLPKNKPVWGEDFKIKIDFPTGGTKKFPLGHMSFEPGYLTAWNPLQIDYKDPIFLRLDQNATNNKWFKSWVVVPENWTENDWVYLALGGINHRKVGAHPIHLHGHDFAVLQQESDTEFDFHNFYPKLDNPPRRDVVLLPNDGFVVIAFKADNPGNWIMHCHIAFHASWGLGLQILERQGDANKLWPKPDSPAIAEAERVCANWRAFESPDNCKQHWPGWNETGQCWPACEPNNCTVKFSNHVFMDDSGI